MFRSRLLMAGAIAGALAALPAAAQAATPNSWRAGPSMSEPRQAPSFAKLADGRVLFIGDANPVTAQKDVDAYSPATNSFALVAPLNQTRQGPLVVTLSDGRVLAAGGHNASDTSAEIYDPAHDTWTPVTGTMHAVRNIGAGSIVAAGAVAPLPGGKALLVGGKESGGPDPTASADIFDPTLNSGGGGFTAAPDMSTPRAAVGAAVLPSGDVLVVGGTNDGQHALSTGEVYHPSSNTWTPVDNQLAVGHVAPMIAALPGGRVLIAGGIADLSDESITTDSEIYDPTTNRFTPTSPMLQAVLEPASAALPDGRVVATGGESVVNGASGFGGTQVYEPTVNGWVPGATPLGLSLLSGLALPSGEVLTTLVSLNSATATQIYAPATVPSVPTDVTAQAGDGKALVTWAPAADNGRPVQSYTVRASNGATVTTPDAREQATVAVPNGVPVTFTVTATNDLGPSGASAPSAAVTPSPTAKPDTTPPTIKITGLKSKLKRKSFLKGLTATIKPSEAVSLAITLYGSARRVTIAKAYNVILASKSFGRSASARKLKLKPNKKLVGHARKFTVRLKIVATDAAGNRRTVTKTVRVSG